MTNEEETINAPKPTTTPHMIVHVLSSAHPIADAHWLQHLLPGTFAQEEPSPSSRKAKASDDDDVDENEFALLQRDSSSIPVLLVSESQSVTFILVPPSVLSDTSAFSSSCDNNINNHNHHNSVVMWVVDDASLLQQLEDKSQTQQTLPSSVSASSSSLHDHHSPTVTTTTCCLINDEYTSCIIHIQLPSGARLIVVSPLLVASQSGRQQLLQQPLLLLPLRKSTSNGNDENKEDDRRLSPSLTPRALSPIPPCSKTAVSSSSSSSSPPRDEDVSSLLFPRLTVRCMQQGNQYTSFPINARASQPFETDLFKGRMLLVMRPPQSLEEHDNDAPQSPSSSSSRDDNYWHKRIFQNRKRRIWIQVQGQFKKVPTGTVFAGAEISEPMTQLGLITKGLSRLLLRIVEGFNPTVHFSYGSNHRSHNEHAHIVAPAYAFFEQFLVTKPGEPPPELGVDWDESKESKEKRKKPQNHYQFAFNTVDTYSFAFYSMYLDLPTWKIVNVPMVGKGDISLKTFWQDSALRIVMYETIHETKPKEHIASKNRYAFLLEINYNDKESSCRPNETEALFRMSGGNYAEEGDSTVAGDVSATESDIEVSSEIDDYCNSDDNDEEESFYDALQNHPTPPVPVDEPVTIHSRIQPVLHPSVDLLSRIDQHCPFFLDVPKSRGSGYTRVFVTVHNAYSSAVDVFARSLQEVEELVDHGRHKKTVSLIEETFSPRLSRSERLRRVLGFLLIPPPLNNKTPLSTATESSNKSIHSQSLPASLFKENRRLDTILFRKSDSTTTTTANSNPGGRVAKWVYTGVVARAISDRHWKEEWMSVNAHNICFQKRHPVDKHHHRSKVHNVSARIQIRSIETIAPLAGEHCPNVPGYSFLIIETLGRCVYLYFANDALRDAFIRAIEPLRRPTNTLGDEVNANRSEESSLLAVDMMDNPCDEFMHKSTLWNLKNRRLLNGGQFFFAVRMKGDRGGIRDDALSLVSEALRQASAVSNDESQCDDLDPSSYNQQKQLRYHTFLRAAAALKQATVLHLPETSRLVFFLNLYHLMILHAFLVLGPPRSSFQWASYFNQASYEIADDIFSLAELEHCIIRANMCPPSQFLSRFILPSKSSYRQRGLALLKIRDYRLNFALNCGSRSCPSHVPVYTVPHLNEQLDAATRLYLQCATVSVRGSTTTAMGSSLMIPTSCSPPPSALLYHSLHHPAVVVDNNTNTVILYLPRICQWFSADFGDGSDVDLVCRVAPFLPHDDVVRRSRGVLERIVVLQQKSTTTNRSTALHSEPPQETPLEKVGEEMRECEYELVDNDLEKEEEGGDDCSCSDRRTVAASVTVRYQPFNFDCRPFAVVQ